MKGDTAIRKFDFYEFVGVLAPGTLLLFGIGVLFPAQERLKPFLLPTDFGSATVYVILAYAVGHLVQAIGNLLEWPYWGIQKGMPTDWPFTKASAAFPASYKDHVSSVLGQSEFADVADWRRAVSAGRSLISADGFAGRLQTFNGNYGLFRGMAASAIVLLVAAVIEGSHGITTYVVIGVVTVLSTYRMHRFATHYGREFFSSMRAWKAKNPGKRE